MDRRKMLVNSVAGALGCGINELTHEEHTTADEVLCIVFKYNGYLSPKQHRIIEQNLSTFRETMKDTTLENVPFILTDNKYDVEVKKRSDAM